MLFSRALRFSVFIFIFGQAAAVLAQTSVPPFGTAQPTTNTPPPLPPAAATATSSTSSGDVIRVLLTPELETSLVAQMTGQVSKLNAQLGKQFQQGETVASFDCREPEAKLRMAQAEFKAAKETQTVKERLRKLEAASDMEVTLAAAGTDKAAAAIALSRAQLAQCTVTAPFTGRIVKTHIKQYQGVNIGAPLVDMISDGPLKLRLNIPSRWLREVNVGTKFEVSINETGRTYPAKVSLINARVDAVAQTIELEAHMENVEPDLLAGMSGIAHFKLTQQPATQEGAGQ